MGGRIERALAQRRDVRGVCGGGFWGETSNGVRTECGQECCDVGKATRGNQAGGKWIRETLKAE